MKFGTVLNDHKGLGPGFDFLRVFLALAIVLTHSWMLTGNLWLYGTPLWFTEYALVPMFFALSGFLVSGSAMRLSLGNFLINRGLRIVPALAVDIAVCALVIGPIVTTVALKSYFTHPDFFSYFLNITGYIHYSLPGVFKDHLNTRVNGALWTVPYEIFCYVIMSFLMVTKFVKRPLLIATLTIVILLIGLVAQSTAILAPLPTIIQKVVKFFFVSRGAQLFVAFLLGILAYQLKDRIPYSWKIFAGCVAICALAAIFLKSGETELVRSRFVLIPALTYITVFIGLTPVPIPKFFKSGDYSYGIYLYHDPFLQCVINVFPRLSLIPGFGALFTFLVGIPVVILFATGSWHWIEKPILGLRKKFSFVARVRGVADVPTDSVAAPLEDQSGASKASAA